MNNMFRFLVIAVLTALMVALPTSSAFAQIKTLAECKAALDKCEAENEELGGQLKTCENFVREHCDWDAYQLVLLEYKKEKQAPPANKPFVPPTCTEEPVVEGDGPTPVVGYVRPVCVVTYKDFAAYVREAQRRFDALCHADKIELSDEERALLEESDPNLLAQVEKRNDPVQCRKTGAHIVALLAFMKKQERMNADQITFNTKIQSYVDGLAMDISGLEAALLGVCQPEEGQSLAEACQAFGDMVRAKLHDHEKRITKNEKDIKDLQDELNAFNVKGTHVQLGGTGGYLFRPGGGPGTGIVGARVNLIEKFSPNWGVLIGGQLGAGFSSKEQVHSGASVNGYHVFNGDDPDADTFFALRFGPAVSVGAPFESHVDEWNIVGELGLQVLPGHFFLDVAVQAGGTRAAVYPEVNEDEYRGVSDVATVVGVNLTLGANLF